MLKKIARNTFSQILSKIFTAIIAIFLLSVLTKYLPTDVFWEYNKIYNYLAIFTFLADLGLYTISIREISKDNSKASFIIWNVMTLRLFLSFFIILSSIFIALFLPWYNSFSSLIWIFVVAIFSMISLMNSSVLSMMQAFMKIEFSLFSVVLWKIVNFVLILWIIYYLFPKEINLYYSISLIYIFIAWLLWLVINFLLNFYYANKIAKIRFLFDFNYIKYIFITSLPYWVALFLSVVYFKVDILILSIMESPLQANISIALYSLPMKIVEVLMVLWVFFLNSILPLLSWYFEQNKKDKINELIKNSFRFLFWFGMFIVVLWSIFAKDILLLIWKSEYIDNKIYTYTSYDIFVIVLFILMFYFISMLFTYLFIVDKKEKTILKINIFITIFNIIWNIIIIPFYSFYWSAIITLLSQILLFFILYFYSRNIIKIEFDYKYIISFLLFSWVFYLLWSNILKYFDFNIYINLFWFWVLFTFIYLWFFYFINKKIIKKWFRN